MARNSSDDTSSPQPKKQRWYHQLWQAYTFTREYDTAVTWIVLGAFVGVIAVAEAIGFATGHPVYSLMFGIPFGALAAMFLLSRRVQKAQYKALDGRAGATLALLRNGPINRVWTFDEEPVAFSARPVDPNRPDIVIRGVGRPGVALVSEGPPHRVKKLLEAEQRRITRVLPNVPVTLIQCGDEDGQVPLPKLESTLRKMKQTLTKPETAEVAKRLRALGGAKLPIPKGVDPTRMRPDRKGIRGK